MITLPAALLRAFASLAHPRMLLLMIWPIAASLVLWTILAILFGAQLLGGAESWLSGFSLYQRFATAEPWATVTTILLWLLGFLLFIPLVLMTASLIIGVISMPMMVRHVAEREYPQLARAKGGSATGSVWNAVVAVGLLVVLVIVTLPLWIVPMLWPFIPLALLGWFNQRLFRYDAIAEHASPEEMRAIFRDDWGRLWMLGIALAAIGHVPVLGFFMPVLGGLAFIHYGLARIAQMRGNAVVGVPQTPTGTP